MVRVTATRPSTALTAVRDSFRTQLWPLPTLGVAVAVALGAVLPRLDRRYDDDLPNALTDWLFGGDAAAARTVLSAVSSSLITVTSLTFSLTVVTLQLASSQFSPRLLRTFVRDRFVQATLALFLGTFTFTLTVLRTVRTEDADGGFVPQMSVTFAFVLAVASVLGLVLFLAHLAKQIRVETMLRTVHAEALATVHRLLPEEPEEPGPVSLPDGPATPLPAGSSGFLVRIDEDALLAAAEDAGAIVVVDRSPGGSVVAGTPVGAAWSDHGSPLPQDAVTRLAEAVGPALVTGPERTGTDDVGYGLRQLTDVAAKALSPGINDPTTAVHALGHTADLLCVISRRAVEPRVLRDEAGRVRVVLRRPTFAELLGVALDQPLAYGRGDRGVLTRLLVLLREVAWAAPPAHRPAVRDHLERVKAAVDDADPADRDRLQGLVADVDQALAGSWQAGAWLTTS